MCRRHIKVFSLTMCAESWSRRKQDVSEGSEAPGRCLRNEMGARRADSASSMYYYHSIPYWNIIELANIYFYIMVFQRF